MALKVVILAAGKGTRMRSNIPKVLQPLAQQPLLQHVVNTAKQLQSETIITIVGHGAEQVELAMQGQNLVYALQEQQLGTGHAVQQAMSYFDDEDTVLILYGDVPLTAQATLQNLLSLVDDVHPLSLLTITLNDPFGYGRIVRNGDGLVEAIVEEKDALSSQKTIQEVNTGMMAVNGLHLKKWLSQLSSNNAQGEYYLTDVIASCVADGYVVKTTQPLSEMEVLGVNNKQQLQSLERLYQQTLAEGLMTQGATVMDASRLDIRGAVSVGQDVVIDVNVIFEGTVKLGNRVSIGANCILKNVEIDDDAQILPFSHLEQSHVGASAVVGPFARLRPGTDLGAHSKVGNFVETKNAKIGQGSKISHLSYIGDTRMGQDCNIGAGTITCNYDGVNKHLTQIGDRVFVGSDTQLVAPVMIADDATIGAGSTITKPVPAGELTLSRAKQLTISGWQKPIKK